MEDLLGGGYSIHAVDEAFVHVLIEKPEGRRLHEKHRRGWKDKLKIIQARPIRYVTQWYLFL